VNLGCFVAGTKLWTPGGYRSIETLLPGDLVYSRDEWNPSAAVEAKVVEDVFTRFAGILHLHLGGQVIGTSGEHPFYVDGRGWVPAGELHPGEYVLCADGSRVLVEEVYTRFAGILHVHLGGQVVGTSGEHPFYVDGRGWVPAGELQPTSPEDQPHPTKHPCTPAVSIARSRLRPMNTSLLTRSSPGFHARSGRPSSIM
jgi:Pretoxin HINT domain